MPVPKTGALPLGDAPAGATAFGGEGGLIAAKPGKGRPREPFCRLVEMAVASPCRQTSNRSPGLRGTIMKPRCLFLLATVALALPAAAAEPLYKPFGYDLTAFDKSVKPGDVFFQYANGSYLKR